MVLEDLIKIKQAELAKRKRFTKAKVAAWQ